MKRNSIYSYSGLSLLMLASPAFAHVVATDDIPTYEVENTVVGYPVTTPVLEGGITASIGALYLVPSADNQGFALQGNPNNENVNVINFDPNYDFGFDASLGYLFEGTSNAIELYYRELNADTNDTVTDLDFGGVVEASGTLSYELNALDLMISQFIDVGASMQMRISGGLSYVDLQQSGSGSAILDTGEHDFSKNNSQYTGWGPRIALDTRYDFGQGFGIVGGGSMAYYLGELDVSTGDTAVRSDTRDNHTVANFRTNLGIDYVYFLDNEERSTVGLELGYMADYYNDGVGDLNIGNRANADTYAVSFTGPYLNLKGVF